MPMKASSTGPHNKPPGAEKKGSLTSNSSSYSFLELPWSHGETHVLENARYLDRYRASIEGRASTVNSGAMGQEAVHTEASARTVSETPAPPTDPMLYPYDVLIPRKLKRFVDSPPFRFSFVAQSCLEIQEGGTARAKIDVLDFKTVDSGMRVETSIVFVINRRRMRQVFVAEENRNYKNAISQSTDYERGRDRFREMSDMLFAYQIRHKVNFIDISTKDDFVREIKCIVKSFSEKRCYVPKVKTFSNGQSVFACYVLSMIPGISKNAAEAIAERFGSIAAFLKFLESNALDELHGVEVQSNDKTQKRPLGERQCRLPFLNKLWVPMKDSSHFFRQLGLDPRLARAISHRTPTPIQRKAIPAVLANQNIFGIARTGSGKTLAYLIPVVQKVVAGKKVLILVPTRDLVHQVHRVLRRLTCNIEIKIALAHGGIKDTASNFDIIIATVGKLLHDGQELCVDVLVVDEIDRILEEDGMRSDFQSLEKRLPRGRQTVYFSATLPERMIDIVSEFTLIKVDTELSNTLQHYFFYVPSPLREAALLFLMSQVTSKTIIFASTKYSVELAGEVLKDYNARIVYSSMDNALRKRNMDDFIKGTACVLVVTDLAARGLDIPDLDVAINYDLCDEKTFLHRVGRVARNGRAGAQYSIVSYKDVFFFLRIRETYFPEMEIGSIPCELLDTFSEKLRSTDLEAMRKMAERANAKAHRFAKKTNVEPDLRKNIQSMVVHSYFIRDREKGAVVTCLPVPSAKDAEEDALPAPRRTQEDFRDSLFIPYSTRHRRQRGSSQAPSGKLGKKSVNAVDEEWRRRKNILFGKGDGKKPA
ncbi:UNVERIFIED_CONTAM: hypothetical protein PYX00_011637 [Menopon gallinae]|uniref:RNA helicase n=1 Tax=Menopon gallinae TaxID=328185 RepID=A0AAW2H8A5_9NEOP